MLVYSPVNHLVTQESLLHSITMKSSALNKLSGAYNWQFLDKNFRQFVMRWELQVITDTCFNTQLILLYNTRLTKYILWTDSAYSWMPCRQCYAFAPELYRVLLRMFYFKSLHIQNYKINTVVEHKIHDNSRHWHFIFTNIPVQNYR
jgi:hypothetical protein